MHPSHLSKVVFNTKISQPKIDMQVRIINFYSKRERERERERIFTFFWCQIWIEWKREQQNFIVNKMEEEE